VKLPADGDRAGLGTGGKRVSRLTLKTEKGDGELEMKEAD